MILSDLKQGMKQEAKTSPVNSNTVPWRIGQQLQF
jgi:hypothetical protein